MQTSRSRLASLRYRRPYWMLFLHNVDNWRIYTVIQQPDHQRTEMLYQAWLGGLDRAYTRPKCMAHQPVWLSKKRHMMQRARLQGAETALEKYVLEWYKRFHNYGGSERPTADDLHTAFDLVERPLDLSYACQLLRQCRNVFNIPLATSSFLVFLEACLRVDRKDCAQYALAHAEPLGFAVVDDNCRRYLTGEQTWYTLSPLDNLYYPLDENVERNAQRTAAVVTPPSAAAAATTSASRSSDDKHDDDNAATAAAAAAATTTTAAHDVVPPTMTTAAAAEAIGATLPGEEATHEEIARLQAELAQLELQEGAEAAAADVHGGSGTPSS